MPLNRSLVDADDSVDVLYGVLSAPDDDGTA